MHCRGGFLMSTRGTNISEKISGVVDKKKEEIVKFCQNLVRIPSTTGNEADAQEFIADYLRSLDLTIDMWEPDVAVLKKHPAFVPTERGYKNRPNVVGIYEGRGSGRSLILNGHIDVVTPEPIDKWSFDPFGAEISNSRIFGRGACDMKAGLTAMIKAVEVLLELNLRPMGNVILEIVVEEEGNSGGNGALASVLRGYIADGAIIPEPTSCEIHLAHRGGIFWRVHITGKGTHAGTKYRGVSAVEKGIVIHNCLLELEKTRNKTIGKSHPLYKDYPLSTPVCIGKFNGGQFTAAIPENCILEGSMEFLPGERVNDIKRAFKETVNKCCENDEWLAKNRPRVEWTGMTTEASEIKINHPLVQSLQASFRQITCKEPKIGAFEAGCDMRIKVLYGNTPSLLFGPGNLSEAHRVDEFVTIDQMLFSTKVLALTILEWCGLP